MEQIVIITSLVLSPIISFIMMYLLLDKRGKMSRFLISLFLAILVWALFSLLNIQLN